MATQPTFKRGQTVYLSHIGMGAGACWSFDIPCTVLRRLPGEALDGSDLYLIRDESVRLVKRNRPKFTVVAEALSADQISYPGMTWLQVLDARGLPRPAGFTDHRGPTSVDPR